jgi:hypothetical protein
MINQLETSLPKFQKDSLVVYPFGFQDGVGIYIVDDVPVNNDGIYTYTITHIQSMAVTFHNVPEGMLFPDYLLERKTHKEQPLSKKEDVPPGTFAIKQDKNGIVKIGRLYPSYTPDGPIIPNGNLVFEAWTLPQLDSTSEFTAPSKSIYIDTSLDDVSIIGFPDQEMSSLRYIIPELMDDLGLWETIGHKPSQAISSLPAPATGNGSKVLGTYKGGSSYIAPPSTEVITAITSAIPGSAQLLRDHKFSDAVYIKFVNEKGDAVHKATLALTETELKRAMGRLPFEVIKISTVPQGNAPELSKDAFVFSLPASGAVLAKKYKSVLCCAFDASNEYMQTMGLGKLDSADKTWYVSHPNTTTTGLPFEYTFSVLQALVQPYAIGIKKVYMKKNVALVGKDDILQWMEVLGVNPSAQIDRNVSNYEYFTQVLGGLDIAEMCGETTKYNFEFVDELPSKPLVVMEGGYISTSYAAGGGHASYFGPRRRSSTWEIALEYDKLENCQYYKEPELLPYTATEVMSLDVINSKFNGELLKTIVYGNTSGPTCEGWMWDAPTYQTNSYNGPSKTNYGMHSQNEWSDWEFEQFYNGGSYPKSDGGYSGSSQSGYSKQSGVKKHDFYPANNQDREEKKSPVWDLVNGENFVIEPFMRHFSIQNLQTVGGKYFTLNNCSLKLKGVQKDKELRLVRDFYNALGYLTTSLSPYELRYSAHQEKSVLHAIDLFVTKYDGYFESCLSESLLGENALTSSANNLEALIAEYAPAHYDYDELDADYAVLKDELHDVSLFTFFRVLVGTSRNTSVWGAKRYNSLCCFLSYLGRSLSLSGHVG